MKNILIIIKKELLRVLKDPRLIIMLILPGLLIYFMYNFMGNMITDNYGEDADMEYKIVAVNISDTSEIEEMLSAIEGFNFTLEHETDLAGQMELLHTGEIHIILVENLGSLIINYNPNVTNSTYANAYIQQAVLFGSGTVFKAIEEVNTMSFVTQLVPFLLLTFLFSGCMGVAPDAIAGEKERGTIATILITPIKRSELALGKVLALGILAIISATASFLGLMLSLPALLGGSGAAVGIEFSQYLLIFLVLVSTVLIIIGAMAILSAFAKSVKEANMLIMPLMFLSMLVGLTTMINGAAATNFAMYLIPLYNTVQAIISILNSAVVAINPVNLIVTIVSNLIYMAVFVFILTKLFNNEKVMFKK